MHSIINMASASELGRVLWLVLILSVLAGSAPGQQQPQSPDEGFLQQFTDNKEVLRAAVARIGHVPYVVSDYGGNPGARMTEYMALTIERKNDANVFEFYVQDCMKWAPRSLSRVERGATRRHCNGSHLRFMTFIYNAAHAAATTDLAAQVQVYKDGQAVISSPFKKVPSGSDVDRARVPFTEDINLGALQAGRYVLQVTVEDRAANKSVSQQSVFYVQ